MSALPPALGGERFEFDSPAGRLSCYAAGQGAPLLLVHSVNAAASAAEVRPLYEHWQAARTVFAVDLPGYGLSDRSDRAYTPRLMTDALHATLEQIQQRCGKAPVDALAVSLGCEFLARAAVEAPARVRRLALVSPTGFNGTNRRPSWSSSKWRSKTASRSSPGAGPPGSVVGAPWIERMVRGPGWGGPLFRALTRPSVIRYFLRRTWGGPAIDEAMARYAELTTRVPGAEHAPLAFLSAQLFSQDINTVYEQLVQPVWMSHGVRGDFTDYRGKDSVEGRPNWRFTAFFDKATA